MYELMRDERISKRLVRALVGVVALGLIAAGCVLAVAIVREEQRDENLAQLGRACAGLLPEVQLAEFVADDSAGVLEEYGTMLDPGQESRALVDCALSWGSGVWEPEAQVKVRAEALLDGRDHGDAKAPDDPSDFVLPLPPGVRGSTGTEERIVGSEVYASLWVACPNGLRGRRLPSKELHVTVALPSTAEFDHEVTPGEHLAAARAAVRIANWVTERQKCGSAPIGTAGTAVAEDRETPTKPCRWLDPKALGFAEGPGWKDDSDRTHAWTFNGDAAHLPQAAFCAGALEGYASFRDEMPVVQVEARSWSGEAALGAYERYAADERVPARPAKPASASFTYTGLPPVLALWAESVCDGGRTYHRVAVTPDLPDLDEKDPKLTVAKKARERFSADARAVLDRYLAADGGWAARSHCRDTRILGEVEEWGR
ncbi:MULTISPECIES: hypothetical protein [Streptomyces]|uniref:Uncharacterized protein n=1 Tax=Streptomyces fradiae ATCC 10745 = DSM 40063 TaxID=1319510 RepID=A0ABQ6XYF0_STRFR|nr:MULTISPECIES: hypothetical protein [Streptomyces]KAF0650755.1 hypothetical protein K701_07090 [Streptomyces fradiae ATCC 10745 = DSM 40063]